MGNVSETIEKNASSMDKVGKNKKIVQLLELNLALKLREKILEQNRQYDDIRSSTEIF